MLTLESSLIILGLANIAWAALEPQSLCYNPDGTFAEGNFPCFLGQEQSPCCGGNTICTGSGLCKPPDSTGVSNLIRGTCTDRNWESPECPLYCMGMAPLSDASSTVFVIALCPFALLSVTDIYWSHPGSRAGGNNVISCQNVTESDHDFCCDHEAFCCDSGIGRFRVPFNEEVVTLGAEGATVTTHGMTSTRAATTTTSTSSSSGSFPPSSITTSSTVPTDTPAPNSGVPVTPGSPGLTTGAIAGIGAACGVLVLGLIAAAVGFYVVRRRRNKRKELKATTDTKSVPVSYMYPGPYDPPKEMDGAVPPAEVMGPERDHALELPGNYPPSR